jgi:iron(III) transport system ATP-binding protein
MPESPADISRRPAGQEQHTSLVVEGLCLDAGERQLVQDLSFTLNPGDRLVLVGGNGTGKSTLLSALAGLTGPTSGMIKRPASPPGMLFQDGALWPHMNVAQHLEFVDSHGDVLWRERLLQAFELSHLLSARPEALSGGERLRLGIARALADRPQWVMLDEPLAHLDQALSTLVRERLPALLDELGASSLVVTHSADDVMHFGDRLLALSGHGSWWLGDARQAINSPPTPELAAFSERGTLLSGVADAAGHADFGLGLGLTDCAPGEPVQAFLHGAAVRFAQDHLATTARFVASDRRGGSWVRLDGRLLRCGDPGGTYLPGDDVPVLIQGRLQRFDAPKRSAR